MRLAEYGDAVLMLIAAVYFSYQVAYCAGVDSSLYKIATPALAPSGGSLWRGERDIGTIRVQIFGCHLNAMRD